MPRQIHGVSVFLCRSTKKNIQIIHPEYRISYVRTCGYPSPYRHAARKLVSTMAAEDTPA